MKSIPEGIIVSKEEMKVHTLRNGQNQWDGNFQQHIRLYLGEYLPSAVQMENGDVRFTMNDDDREIVAHSIPSNRSWSAVAPLMLGFQQAMDRFLATASDESVDPTIREMVQGFQLPSPVTMPEAWRIAQGSKGPRLLVLWGFESNAGDGKTYSFLPAGTGNSIPLENRDKRLFAPGLVQESGHKGFSTLQKFLGLLLIALLALLGFFIWKLIQVSSPSYEVSVINYEPLENGQGARCTLAVRSSTNSPLPSSVEWFVDGTPVPEETGPELERQFDPKNHEVKASFAVKGKNYTTSSNLFVCKGTNVLVIDKRPVEPTTNELPYRLNHEPFDITDDHQIISRFSIDSPSGRPLPDSVAWDVDGNSLDKQESSVEVTLPSGFHRINAHFQDEIGQEYDLTDSGEFLVKEDQGIIVINPPTDPPIRPTGPVIPPPPIWPGFDPENLFDFFNLKVFYHGIEDGKRICSFELESIGDYTARVSSWETDGVVQRTLESRIERALEAGAHCITVNFQVLNADGLPSANLHQITQRLSIGAIGDGERPGRLDPPEDVTPKHDVNGKDSLTGNPPIDVGPNEGGGTGSVDTPGTPIVTGDDDDDDTDINVVMEDDDDDDTDIDVVTGDDDDDDTDINVVTGDNDDDDTDINVVTGDDDDDDADINVVTGDDDDDDADINVVTGDNDNDDTDVVIKDDTDNDELPPIPADEISDYFDIQILHIGNRDGKGRYSFNLVPFQSYSAKVQAWKIDKKKQTINGEPITKPGMIKTLPSGTHRVMVQFEIFDEHKQKFSGNYSTSKDFEVGNVEKSESYDQPHQLVKDEKDNILKDFEIIDIIETPESGHEKEVPATVVKKKKKVKTTRPNPPVVVDDIQLSYHQVSVTPKGSTYSFMVISEDTLPSGIQWLVDDQEVGSGETLEYFLEPGTHNVTAKIPSKDGKFLKPTVSFTVKTVTTEVEQ